MFFLEDAVLDGVARVEAVGEIRPLRIISSTKTAIGVGSKCSEPLLEEVPLCLRRRVGLNKSPIMLRRRSEDA